MSEAQNIKTEDTGGAVKSLAIVPFRLLNEKNAENPILGIGLADALTTRLCNVKGLSVKPTSSVLQLAKTISDPFALGKRLKVDYILDGYILPIGQRTRFSVQLLNISAHSVLWAAQFDESEADIFSLEDSISTRVVESVVPHLTDVEQEAPENKFQNNFVIDLQKEEIREKQLSDEHETLLFPAEGTEKRARPLWIGGTIAAVILLSVTAFFAFRYAGNSPQTGNATASAKTVVVLPFQAESTASRTIGIGLADVLTSKLGIVNNLSVLSASAGRAFMQTGKEPQAIARELKANYVLRGKLENKGDKTEVIADFFDAAENKVLWTENFGAENSDLISLQTEIAERVLQTLDINLSEAQRQRFIKKYTADNFAYELYLVGRYQMTTRSVEGLNRAITTFSAARDRDPNFAPAYVGLADAYSLLNLYQIPPPPDGYAKAKENALKAISLDENLSEAHASLAYVKFYGDHDRAGAINHFRRATELNPSYATAHHWFALVLAAMNRPEEALSEIKTAQRLDPRSAIIQTATGMIYYYSRQYDRAIAELERALELDSGVVPAHKTMRWIYQKIGNYEKALAAFQKERSFAGGSDDDCGWAMIRAQVEAVGNRREAALASLKQAAECEYVIESPASYAYEMALAYTALGEKDKAFEWLDTAEKAQTHSINYVVIEPRFDPLRSDPRFRELIGKLQYSPDAFLPQPTP